MNSEHWISHGMANPLIESFGESPKACVTNSSCPPANLKGKENPDLPSVCSNYYTGFLTWLSVCVLNHLVLSTFRQCRSAIPQRSAKPIANPPHNTVTKILCCSILISYKCLRKTQFNTQCPVQPFITPQISYRQKRNKPISRAPKNLKNLKVQGNFDEEIIG